MLTSSLEALNKHLIKAFQNNQIVPWQQPWVNTSSAMPVNVVTRKFYKDIDPILLRLVAFKNNYTSKWWGTENQWAVLCGSIKPEVKGVRVPYNKEQAVYNLDAVDGDFKNLRKVPQQIFAEAVDQYGNSLWDGMRHMEAERIIRATKVDFREEDRDGALYHRLPDDYIVIPRIEQFWHGMGGPEGFYSTAFHELMHASEHRLNWFADPHRSSKDRYIIGELRADIGAAYLCAACGIPPQKDEVNFDPRTNFCRYLKHWLRIMGEDNTFIFRIAKAASEGVDYILSLAGGYNGTAIYPVYSRVS